MCVSGLMGIQLCKNAVALVCILAPTGIIQFTAPFERERTSTRPIVKALIKKSEPGQESCPFEGLLHLPKSMSAVTHACKMSNQNCFCEMPLACVFFAVPLQTVFWSNYHPLPARMIFHQPYQAVDDLFYLFIFHHVIPLKCTT